MRLFNKNLPYAKQVKPNDAITALFPYLMPRRCDAEVSAKYDLDITKLTKWVDKHNESKKLKYKMTYFHALSAVLAKTVHYRPRLNRFVKNKKLYERYDISLAFVAKNKFSDNAEEKLVYLEIDKDDTALSLSRKMAIDVFEAKNNTQDDTLVNIIDKVTSLPNFLMNFIFGIVFFLDKRSLLPKSIYEGDSNHATLLLSNLGSINAGSCYHHLNEYGTNSIMITIGKIIKNNNKTMVDMTFTFDERIADGFYFAKSIDVLKEFLDNPQILEDILLDEKEKAQ